MALKKFVSVDSFPYILLPPLFPVVFSFPLSSNISFPLPLHAFGNTSFPLDISFMGLYLHLDNLQLFMEFVLFMLVL